VVKEERVERWRREVADDGQRTFAGVAWGQKGKVTRRERFLAEMDAVIPWYASTVIDPARGER
jgi:hypothetical protein